MSDSKMQVLFMKQTGHVLAAFTRFADPESKLKVEDVAGAGFPFHNVLVASVTPQTGGESILLPPEAMDVAVVDFEEEAFLLPLGFVASGTKVNGLGTIEPDATSLTSTQITIHVTTAVSEKTKVWAAVQQVDQPFGDEPVRRVGEGEIPVGAQDVILELKSVPDLLPVSISNGEYDVIVLVAGQLPHVKRLPVP